MISISAMQWEETLTWGFPPWMASAPRSVEFAILLQTLYWTDYTVLAPQGSQKPYQIQYNHSADGMVFESLS